MSPAKQDDGLATLKKELQSGEVGNLYVFHGEEKYLLDYYVEELRKRLIPEGMEDFNLFRFDGRGLEGEQLVDACEGLPVFCEKKMVVVTDCDLYKPPAALKSTLEELCGDLPDYTCLVFEYNTLEYKPDARSKMSKLIKEKGSVVEFKLQETRELCSWIARRFKAQGKGISQATAEYMLFICGREMTALIHEAEKLAAYAAGDTIEKADIDAACSPVLDAVVYDMTDAVGEGKYSKALKILADLIGMRQEPIVILSALSRQLRQMLYAAEAQTMKNSEDVLKQAAGINSPYILRKVMASARNRPSAWYKKAVTLSAECDFDMKSSAGDNAELLKTLLMTLAALQ